MHVEQAELVFEAHQVPAHRYEFRCASVFDLAADNLGTFDVVLCLGLLYHTSRPMELLQWAARVNSDVLLIDTALSGRDGSVLEIAFDNPDDPRSSCDGELVFYPSRQAVLDMVRYHGYRAVVLEPHFDDYAGAEDFRAGRRRAFLCAKRTSLDAWEAR
jgi:SAM-dependent methyltransferase